MNEMKMESILIKNGRLLDPSAGLDRIGDLFLDGGTIREDADGKKADRVIDASGCYVMPGLIDMHVHLRDPGQTDKETVATGTAAAAHGGFTTIVAMPNTTPAADCPEVLDYVRQQALTAPVHVIQAGSATRGEQGRELSDLKGMAEHGLKAVSEDGRSVMDASLCREMLEIIAGMNIPFLDHCEDKTLVRGGCVNEDDVSRAEGLPGICNETEDVIIARDMLLAHAAGAHLHLCHCSTKGSYELMKMAKAHGFDVSAEVCPHHFSLNSSDRRPGDTNYKMNPPLRTKEDQDALIRGLAEGVFDVIATDHAPHTAESKKNSMQKAPFGIVGLETAVQLTITNLVRPGILTPLQMAERMSGRPAEILHLEDRGSLIPGKAADVVVIDPKVRETVRAETFRSKGKNTPFDGCALYGAVRFTICGGKVVYEK